MDDQDTAVCVNWALLNGKDLDLRVIERRLDLEGAAVGVVAAENRREFEEPSLGVLRREGGEKNARKGDQRDGKGEVEPERKWVHGGGCGF